MKNLFFLAALILGAQTLYAQNFAAGTVSLGGSVGYNQFSEESSTTTSGNGGPHVNNSAKASGKQFYLAPSASYFVADNLAIELSLGYYNGTRTDDVVYTPASTFQQQQGTSSTVSLRAGAFAQYYKMISTQFGLTGRLGGGYQRLKEDRNGETNNGGNSYYYNGTATSAGYYADLTPGIVFFPVPKFGISATMGSLNFSHYSLTSSSYSDTSGSAYAQGGKNDSTALAANFGLDSFLLGGTYYFGR